MSCGAEEMLAAHNDSRLLPAATVCNKSIQTLVSMCCHLPHSTRYTAATARVDTPLYLTLDASSALMAGFQLGLSLAGSLCNVRDKQAA